MANTKMDHYTSVAFEEGLKSPVQNRYGAVLVYRNKIISKGFNYYKHTITNSRQGVLCS